MLNMNPAFEIENKINNKVLRSSYSFCKTSNIQRTNSILKNNNIKSVSNKNTSCTVRDLMEEMDYHFNVSKTDLIQSEEYKEWATLLKEYKREKEDIRQKWYDIEDNLALQFEEDQEELVREYQIKEDKLAKKFEDDQNKMMDPFEAELKELVRQYEIKKCALWNKYKSR